MMPIRDDGFIGSSGKSFDLTIDVDVFDLKSVEKAVEKAMYMGDNIDEAFSNAIDEIQARVQIRLQEEIIRYNLEGTGVGASVSVKRKWDGLEIIASAKHAMYVEFGTGIKGAGSPHPNQDFNNTGWAYDINSHGEAGWWYPTTEADDNPVKRYDEKKETWFAWTRGMEARPFMYNTYRYMRLIATKIINKHINKLVNKR